MAVKNSFINTPNWILSNVAPLVIIIIIFYLLVVLPQHNKIKNHDKMVNNLKEGDIIVTSGGIIASFCKSELKNKILIVKISDNTKIKIKKDSISQIIDNNYNNYLKIKKC